MQIFN